MMLTLHEAAAMLGLSYEYFRRLVKAGRLGPVYRTKAKTGRYRIPRETVMNYLRNTREEGIEDELAGSH